MFNFGNVKVGGFFVMDGHRYRKVLHAKCWDPEREELRYFNAVAVKREATPVMRLFDEDDTIENIPYRPDRIKPIPLEAIFEQQERSAQDFRERLDPEDESWEYMRGVADDIDEVLVLARAGNWSEAYQKVRSIDTYDRNWITDEMYDEICIRMGSEP